MVEEIQLGYGRIGCNFNRGAGVPGVTAGAFVRGSQGQARRAELPSLPSVSLFHLFSLAAQRSSKTVAQPILAVRAETVPHITSFWFFFWVSPPPGRQITERVPRNFARLAKRALMDGDGS